MTGALQQSDIRMFDLNGRLVLAKSIPEDGMLTTLDHAVYFYEIMGEFPNQETVRRTGKFLVK